MKSYKIITIIAVILLITIISIASFSGIYKKMDYRIVDVVPKYILGMEFTNSKIVDLKVDTGIESTKIYDKDGNEITEEQEGIDYTEENGYTIVENKANPDDKLTKQNFEKSKKILKARLANLGIEQYIIRQEKESGNIKIQMTQNDNTDEVIANLTKKGTFELIDDETKEVLINENNIVSSNVVYGQTEKGNTVYVQIKFNKEGKQKLEEISKIYVETTTQTTDEEGNTKDSTETKKVSIVLDGETYNTTYFGDTLTNGILNVPIGTSQDNESMQKYADSAKQISVILNKGVLPIKYDETDYILNNNTNLLNNKTIICSTIALIAVISIYVIIKIKLKGVLALILEIGYIALLLLTLRYTNIKITAEGIVGILISLVLNYMYIYKSFANVSLDFIKETTAKFGFKLVPIYIISIIFTFNNIANISSLGMALVWGIIIMYLYNLTLTQITVKTIYNNQEVQNAKK